MARRKRAPRNLLACEQVPQSRLRRRGPAILHLNGYKIANPTVLARISREELEALFRGYGYAPIIVEGDVPEVMHQAMAAAFDQAFVQIRKIQETARAGGFSARPFWPMIVLRSPRAGPAPKRFDGLKTEGSWRSHQVPISDMSKPGHLRLLEEWMASYRQRSCLTRRAGFAPRSRPSRRQLIAG